MGHQAEDHPHAEKDESRAQESARAGPDEHGIPASFRPAAASQPVQGVRTVSYTHLRAHETVLDLVCRLLLEKKKHTHGPR